MVREGGRAVGIETEAGVDTLVGCFRDILSVMLWETD